MTTRLRVALQTEDELQDAERETERLIETYGLDLVLRVCARLALEREAAFRAVQDFTEGHDDARRVPTR